MRHALTLHRLQAEEARRAGQVVVAAIVFGAMFWSCVVVTVYRLGWALRAAHGMTCFVVARRGLPSFTRGYTTFAGNARDVTCPTSVVQLL